MQSKKQKVITEKKVNEIYQQCMLRNEGFTFESGDIALI